MPYPFQISQEPAYTTNIEYISGTNNALYVGEAQRGSATSAAVWRIKKLTYDANNNVTSVKYASAIDDGFKSIWDDRASLTYV